ncbi:MAG: DUF1049 domain-containing protein [Isosphaeraceae bacterium]|nr:DUF1049 domain-containing protein [Isosphaeraceae bacterium]
MTSPYKRRRPRLLRNLWVYRKLVLAAILLGLMLWFVVINNVQVTVYFPFGLGQITSTTGIIILLGAIAGSLVTGLIITLVLAVRHYRTQAGEPEPPASADLLDDRPPSDYAAKTTEGFSDAPWSTR